MGSRRDNQSLLIPALVSGPDPEFDPEFALPADEHPDLLEASATLVKHAGPGNHPSGSPQSVHAGGAATVEEIGRTLLTAAGTNVEFTTDGEATWPQAHKQYIRSAIDYFEEKFPGGLPDDITFLIERFPPREEMTFAYSRSNPKTGLPIDNVIHVNAFQVREGGFFDDSPGARPGSIYPFQKLIDREVGSKRMIAIDASGGDLDKFYEATYFHELAHLIPHPFARLADTPYYSADWFDEPTTPLKDHRLPSTYSVSAPQEFWAEAFTDVAYNDNPSPYSRTVVHNLYENPEP